MTSSEQRNVLLAIVDRIELRDSTVKIDIDPAGLADVLGVTNTDEDVGLRPAPVTLKIDFDLRRSSRGTKIILLSDQPAIDEELVAFVRQAFEVRETLMTDRHDSIETLSHSLGITKAKATNLLRLSWLAPSLVNSILDRNHPASLTPKALLAAAKDLPIDWFEPAKYFNFPAP